MHFIQRARRGDDDTVARQQTAPAAGKQQFAVIFGAAWCRRFGDRPHDAAEGHARVVLADQRRAGKGIGRMLVAVDHSVNHIRAFDIGDGCDVEAQGDNADGPAFDGDAPDIVILIVLGAGGKLAQIVAYPRMVEVALQNFAVARLRRLAMLAAP